MRRTRNASSAAAEPTEPEEEQGPLHRLKFNETLSWRAGRAIPVADLLQRLQSLALELRKLDQEETDRASLTKVSQELAHVNLLAHRDKGVRAWTTCCVVDILRLCAPDAPFTANQLKDIFTAIITSIIPSLADPSNAYNGQHIYVLSSLAEVKSIVLLTDLDHADSLILPLFTSCFDIVSGSAKASTGEELAKNVEYDMTRLLVTVIDEAASLAPEVVDIIIAQFLRVDPRIVERAGSKGKKNGAAVDAKQDTLLLKDYPAAYNMAKAICSACPDKMTSYISQYFNNVIIDASAPSELNGHGKHRRASLDDSDEEGEDIKELSKAHRLIRELWRACPDVLQNVIPQLEAELSAESISLRLLATQTVGDLTAGIGVAGPPPPPPMDPAAWPPVTLLNYSQTSAQPNPLQTPLSPKPFSQAHSTAYTSFLSRRVDKSASVRAAWATAVGRIILTSAGGVGLSENEEQNLVGHLAAMLRDADERVRMSAVEILGNFGFSNIITKVGTQGGLSNPESVLSILAERVKDRKPIVREQATKILARMWAVGSHEIEDNNEQVVSILKEVPSRILDAYYTNDLDLHLLIDHVLCEILLPLNYPPIKSKSSKSNATQPKSSQGTEVDTEPDVDKIRVRRILTLVKGLDDRAKKVFFTIQTRQIKMRSVMTMFLEACEGYNGGVVGKDAETIKVQLTRVVDYISKTLPDSARASADLWKFAKAHDRRNYQLIRFAMAAASDYRTVVKAIKELTKRIQGGPPGSSGMLETLTPLLYRCSSLISNRSHIPAVMELSRTDEQGLANTAHEMLREISTGNPEVLEAHVQEMCKDLETQAPSAKQSDDPGSEEILKACAGFAKRLPEKLPKDRKFLIALSNYALYSSSPRAAKHAVSIIMAGADKKEMYAKDLIKQSVKNCAFGSEHFLTKLATISQLNLLAPKEADEESDAIISIAINEILLKARSSEPESKYVWAASADEETLAKEWALKIIVNRLRAKDNLDEEEFRKNADPVYGILNTLISNEGELSKKKDTPGAQRSRLRLLASKLILKLCSSRILCDQMVTAENFNKIALVAQDALLAVRSGFIGHLKKKLAQMSGLSSRWYTIPFLLAFEPSATLKDSTHTWLRARATFFTRQAQLGGKGAEQQTVMESIFARLLSLLAYHPDYPPTLETSSENDDDPVGDLVDLSRYILFYLSAVANENNLSLIFHITQRVKQVRDKITGSETISTRLHTLSDLAQATIRRFAEIYSQQHKIGGSGGSGAANILQTYPGKMRLPNQLFTVMSSHEEAQSVAEKNFLPEEVDERLDKLVRQFMKPRNLSQARKRKIDAPGNVDSSAKKAKKERTKSLPIRKPSSAGNAKASKKKKRTNEDGWDATDGGEEVPAAARRRSGRGVGKGISYAEGASDDDDVEMEQWDERDGAGEDESESEEVESDDQEEEENEKSEDEEPDEEPEEEDEAGNNETEGDEGTNDVEQAVSSPPLSSKSRRKSSAKQEPTTPKPSGRSTRSGQPDLEKKTETLPTRRSTRRG